MRLICHCLLAYRLKRSMGAATAVLHAASDHHVAGYVMDSPFTGLSALMEEPLYSIIIATICYYHILLHYDIHEDKVLQLFANIPSLHLSTHVLETHLVQKPYPNKGPRALGHPVVTRLDYTVLYYTMICYSILYFTVLHFTILYYTILYYTILHYMFDGRVGGGVRRGPRSLWRAPGP